jgi:PAS domain S-box-containing protein
VALNGRGEVVLINQKACRVLGYTEREIRGRNWFDVFVPPEMREAVRATFQRLLAGDLAPVQNFENQVLTKSGERRLVAWQNALLEDEHGRVTGTLSSGQDITERERTEEQFRQMSRVVEQSPSLVLITDTRGRIEYANPRFCQLTGHTLEELCGRQPSILKSGRTPREEYERLWKTITAGGEWHGEFLNRKRNGEHFWGLATISPIRNARGEITHYLEVMEDITERKRLERAIVSISEEERQWIGRELHDVLGQQLTGISLLSKALARTLAAQKGPGGEDAQSIAELAAKAVREVHDLSHGLYPAEVERNGLSSALAEMARHHERLYHQPVIFEGDGEMPALDQSYAMHLYRIAQEAVNNAVKHARATRIVMSLRMKATPDALGRG